MKLTLFRKIWIIPPLLIGFTLTGCQSSLNSSNKTAVISPAQGVSPYYKKKLKDVMEQTSSEQKKGDVTLQTKLMQYLISNHISGTVAIVKDNRLLFNEGIGYANIKKKTLNNSGTTYPLASITKSMVAACIMQLQEKGKLSIEDAVSKFLPNFPNGKKIKLINLLDHTSGISSPPSQQGVKTPIDLIKKIEQQPIKFQPGKQYDYRNENYVILGYIVEKVSGQPLHTYINQNIFAKAGMKSSGFINQGQPVPVTSVGYVLTNNQYLTSPVSNQEFLYGYSDVYSTAHDLCLYDEALMNGKLISKKSLQEMLVPRSQSKYGLGIFNMGSVIRSYGVLDGYSSLHAIFKDGTYLSILLNVHDKRINIYPLSYEIDKMVAASSAGI